MDAAAPLAVAVPLGIAALLVLFSEVTPRRLADAASTTAAAASGVLCMILLHRARSHPVVYWFGGWKPVHGAAIGVSFTVDPLGAALGGLTALLVTASLVLSWRYFDAVRTLFHALMLIFCASMVGFCLSGDLFNLFVFFELMSVTAYGLTAYLSEDAGPLQGAINFAFSNSVGAFLVLVSIALVYGRTGALNLAQAGAVLAGHRDGLVIVAFALLTAGFLVKGAAVPFHFWLADAHAVAPTPVCVLFSGVMVELGLYAVARIYWTVFAGALPPAAGLRGVLVGLGVASAVVGALMCLAQRHLKRLLAFSTVSHAGIALVGIGLLGVRGLAGAAIYVVGHGLAKGALFVCAGIVKHRTGKMEEDRLFGRGRGMWWTGGCYAVAALALSGMPPFATFAGKGMIEDAAFEHHFGWLVAIIIAASAVTGGAVLRSGGRIFLGWGPQRDPELREEDQPEDEEEPENRGAASRTPITMAAAAGALVIIGLVGIAPGLPQKAESAAARFVDRPAYAAAVIGTPPPARRVPDPPEHPGATTTAALYGLLATALALVVAGAGLSGREAGPWSSRATRPLFAAVNGVRALHTGHIGDYLAWLTFGAASVGGLLALVARR